MEAAVVVVLTSDGPFLLERGTVRLGKAEGQLEEEDRGLATMGWHHLINSDGQTVNIVTPTRK